MEWKRIGLGITGVEKEWIRNKNYGGLFYYKRYVDNIFAIFESKDHAVSFYNYIIKQHRNIKFTMETEKNGKIPFFRCFSV